MEIFFICEYITYIHFTSLIINNTFKKTERINNFDENSNYKVLDTLYNVSPLLYEDPIFNEEGSKPVIINEDLLKTEE